MGDIMSLVDQVFFNVTSCLNYMICFLREKIYYNFICIKFNKIRSIVFFNFCLNFKKMNSYLLFLFFILLRERKRKKKRQRAETRSLSIISNRRFSSVSVEIRSACVHRLFHSISVASSAHGKRAGSVQTSPFGTILWQVTSARERERCARAQPRMSAR